MIWGETPPIFGSTSTWNLQSGDFWWHQFPKTNTSPSKWWCPIGISKLPGVYFQNFCSVSFREGTLVGGLKPNCKNMSQNGFIFPNFRGGNKEYLSCHHLGTTFGSLESNSSYVWQTYFGGIGSNLARDADFDRHLSIFLSDRRVCIKEIPRISVCIKLYVYIYIYVW